MSKLYWNATCFKAFAVVVMLMLTSICMAQADPKSSLLQEIVDRGEIRVGVLDGFRPWAFRGPDGTMQGITIDLARDLAQTIGVELDPVVVTSANRIQFLKQGRIDVIMAGMYDTSSRRRLTDIVEPAYWASGPALMAKEGLISSWEDLRDKPVCVKQGVFYNPTIAQRFGARLVSFGGNTEAKQGLRSGKCVAWAYEDSTIAAEVASGNWEGYEMPVKPLYANPWAAAVRDGEGDGTLGILLSGQIYRWQSTGKMLELAKKWEIKPAEWLTTMHERLEWDTSYLD